MVVFAVALSGHVLREVLEVRCAYGVVSIAGIGGGAAGRVMRWRAFGSAAPVYRWRLLEF